MSVIRKILVVDDDPVVGKSFDRVLSSKGYAVITAANGEEALLKLNNEHYDDQEYCALLRSAYDWIGLHRRPAFRRDSNAGMVWI